jgi:RNA polymerase sigma-32 factor
MFDAAPAATTSDRPRDDARLQAVLASPAAATDRRLALERVLSRHGALARKLARAHRRSWLDDADLVAEGMLGLILAWDRYDPAFGVPFERYARWWVRARIVNFVAVNGRIGSLRKGRIGRRLGGELPKERRRLDPLGASPSVAELAASLRVPVARVEEFLWVYDAVQLPLHQPAPGTEGRLSWEAVIGASSGDPEADWARRQSGEVVRRCVLALSRERCDARERQIIHERLLSTEAISLAALGRRWGVSKQRVSQIERRLLRRIRTRLVQELGLESHAGTELRVEPSARPVQ